MSLIENSEKFTGEILDLPLAKPCYLNRLEIEDKAVDFAKEVNYKPAGKLEEIVESLGGKMNYSPMTEWEKSHEASIAVLGEKNFIINLPNFLGQLRNRFSIAHELGHFVLHSEKGHIRLRATRFGNSLEEQEANLFAASFLMPRDLFRIEMEKNNDAMYLASRFLVSLSAAKYRSDYLAINRY